MAVAKLYPEPEKLKRKGSSSLILKDQNLGAVSMARTVLRHLPEIANQVLALLLSLYDLV